jgi:hypothetical protein
VRRALVWRAAGGTLLSCLPVADTTATHRLALAAGCDPQRGRLVHGLMPGLDGGGALKAVLITGGLMLLLPPVALLTARAWAVIGLARLLRR